MDDLHSRKEVSRRSKEHTKYQKLGLFYKTWLDFIQPYYCCTVCFKSFFLQLYNAETHATWRPCLPSSSLALYPVHLISAAPFGYGGRQ